MIQIFVKIVNFCTSTKVFLFSNVCSVSEDVSVIQTFLLKPHLMCCNRDLYLCTRKLQV